LGWLRHWVLPAFVRKKLPERLGLHHYAVNTHPDEFVPESPPKINPGSSYEMYVVLLYFPFKNTVVSQV